MLKVLIVEDEYITRKCLIHSIDWLSVNCIVVGDASNGLEGLNLIRKYNPDLVITDIEMPVMDGIDMLENAIKKNSFYSIIITGYSLFEYAKHAISLRVYEYILKPVDIKKLTHVIENINAEVSQKKKQEHLMERAKYLQEITLTDIDVYMSHNSKVDFHVRKALEQIKLNYRHKISLDSISVKLGVSPSYLSRKFKDETCHTFLDMLNQHRLQKAIELLKTRKYRIYEVAIMTGFSEYKHLCNVFKKYTKISPSEFVKMNDEIICKRA